MKSWFAILSVVSAIGMLGVAIFYIAKNTPRQADATVERMPPTSPIYDSQGRSAQVQPSEPSPPLTSPPASSNAAIRAGESGQYIGGVGIVEPVGEATVIGSQLPGVVAEICVKPGDSVKAGSPLLRLDQRSAAAALAVANAELIAQQAKLQELLAQSKIQQAKYEGVLAIAEQAKVSLENAKRELARVTTLKGTFALSEEELDNRKVAYDLAQSKSLEAESGAAEAKAQLELLTGSEHPASIEVQLAAIQQAQANFDRAKIDLELRTVVAPSDGTILGVRIRVGEFMPAAVMSTPFITMGVIDPLHIRVDIDESEIPRFHSGAKALASVRGRPEIKTPIEFVRTEPIVTPKKSLTGTVSERVDTRVLQAIYSADPASLGASVGQQVDVYIEATAD